MCVFTLTKPLLGYFSKVYFHTGFFLLCCIQTVLAVVLAGSILNMDALGWLMCV